MKRILLLAVFLVGCERPANPPPIPPLDAYEVFSSTGEVIPVMANECRAQVHEGEWGNNNTPLLQVTCYVYFGEPGWTEWGEFWSWQGEPVLITLATGYKKVVALE